MLRKQLIVGVLIWSAYAAKGQAQVIRVAPPPRPIPITMPIHQSLNGNLGGSLRVDPVRLDSSLPNIGGAPALDPRFGPPVQPQSPSRTENPLPTPNKQVKPPPPVHHGPPDGGDGPPEPGTGGISRWVFLTGVLLVIFVLFLMRKDSSS